MARVVSSILFSHIRIDPERAISNSCLSSSLLRANILGKSRTNPNGLSAYFVPAFAGESEPTQHILAS